MGSQTKYRTKSLVYVDINIPPAGENDAPGESLKYGFFTNIPDANRTDLGQIAVTNFNDPPTGLVLGCSFPKPRRASRREAQRYSSSFVGKNKIDSAKKAGYRVSPSKANSRLILSTTAFVKTVYVKVRGVNYAWNIPKVTETNLGSNLAGLGVIDAVADDRDELVFGADFPKPPRASILKISGDDLKNLETFYDPSKALPEGWTPKKPAKLSL